MSDEDLILPLRRIPEIGEFLAAFGVKRAGLGAQLLIDVYAQLFELATDLRSQYERYYRVEYGSIEQYIELAHDIKLSAFDLERRYILKFKSTHGILDQAYDENILGSVIDVVKRLEGSGEN